MANSHLYIPGKKMDKKELALQEFIANAEDLSVKEQRHHYRSWTNGAQIPLNAEIDRMSDAQLGRCLAHHNFTLKLPADWYPTGWNVRESGW
eukprot:151141-Rhodomonas_salina.1